ncbi:suppressor of fused domain protein [Actinokineospora auranticolor]|uniref:Suppressor of fused protein SUFU n=1 Tax=Actinokineospora auranticolor TaxID=155976 RepID=A0A2S6GWF0_9PSEU|nr:suppressor of fused domain protein [Actinokineospora auranticolor]PPK69565.1 suppressor of fused protein SUFU [Actinokineospora auranticolor]
MAASESNRAIARAAAAAFGGRPTVTRFYDDDERNAVDVLEVPDSPAGGVTSYATLGLSDHPLELDGEEYPARVEILGACDSSVEFFANVVSTAAFCVVNDKWFCAPGAVFPEVVRMYAPESPLPHLFFVSPFLWGDDPGTLELPDKTVAWLMVVPISDSERDYLDANGPDALEALFEEKQIDLFDLTRPPVV